MDDSEAGGYQSDDSIKSQADVPSTSNPDRRNGSESQETFATQLAPAQGVRVSRESSAALLRRPANARNLLSILGSGFSEIHVENRSENRNGDPVERPVEKAVPTNEPQSAREATPKATPKQIPSQSLRPERNNSDTQKDASNSREQTHGFTQKAPIPFSRSSSRDHDGNTGGNTPTKGNHTNINNTPPSQGKKGQKRKVNRSPEGSRTIGENQTGESPRKRPKRSHVPPNTESDPSDPWYGMTRIRRRDVRIPKDQIRLLEDSPCWMPPAPGSPMPHCHVPPALLQQWNDAIIRKFSQSKDDSNRRSPSQVGSPPAPSPAVSGSGDLSQSQSDSESEVSWEASPPHHLQHPLLPPDSPPQRDVRTQSVQDKSRNDPLEPHSLSNKAHERGPESAVVVVAQEKGEQEEQEEPDDPDDESDESDMDMSVPRPLLSGSQQSGTSAAVGSGQTLLSQKSAHEIQVVETPAADFERLRAKRFDNNTVSKADHQHSSQSTRIMATYGSSAPETNDCPPADASTQSEPAISNGLIENGSGEPSGSMLNSQMSLDSNSQSQRHGVEGSQHEQQIVQRRTGSPEVLSVSGSSEQHPPQGTDNSGENGNHSSPRLPSPDEGPMGRDSEKGVSPSHHLSIDRLGQNVAASSVNQSNNELQTDEISSSDPPTDRHAGHAIDGPRTCSIIQKVVSDDRSQAQKAYDEFRDLYRVYNGDFRHFTKMCAKLEGLITRGHLQRSSLWDDFIIRHLEDFPGYLETCISTVEEPCCYEDYFVLAISRPRYKKMALSKPKIKASAAACSPGTVSFSGSFAAQSAPSHSFTGSLVNQLSRLRTSSFQETTNHSASRSGSISRQGSSLS
ncbi:hypothetical protein Plec18170_006713 [Paecilomyces lecythidis]